MTDQPTPPPQDPGRDRYSDRSRHDERWERRSRRDGHWREGGAWFGGVLLILLGGFFLLRNFGVDMPDNWWAVFILIPAFGAFSTAWSLYRGNGGMVTSPVIAAAVGGVFLTLLALAFFIGLDIGKFWPVILIVLGVGALARNFLPRD